MNNVNTLGENEFANHFGVAVTDLPNSCVDLIRRTEFHYKTLNEFERDLVILGVLKKIEEDKQKIAAPERKAVWANGWQEAFDDYINAPENSDSEFVLAPRFIRSGQAVRLNRNYVMPISPNFELNFIKVLREWIFPTFFNDVSEVHEFGCGTGFNLLALAKMNPKINCIGSDFVEPSVKLVNLIAEKTGLKLSACEFDMLNPNPGYRVGENAAFFTFGSLEQLGGKVENFLDFVLSKRPKIIVHIEPVAELYDDTLLVDDLALRFQRKRGYTEGLLSKLEHLQSKRKISLQTVRRLNFGSLMMEGYNLIVWKII